MEEKNIEIWKDIPDYEGMYQVSLIKNSCKNGEVCNGFHWEVIA